MHSSSTQPTACQHHHSGFSTPTENPQLAALRRRMRPHKIKQRYAAAFQEAGIAAQAHALKHCALSYFTVICTSCGHTKQALYRCRLRVCPICSFELTKERSLFMKQHTAGKPKPKLLTLTIQRWTSDPRDGIKHLRQCWAKLRRSSVFKAVKGGAYQIELKRKPNGWHIHIHALLETPYIARQRIFTAWKGITGIMVPQVHITEAPNDKAIEYTAKYVSKQGDFEGPQDTIVQWYRATKGSRLFEFFGEWRKSAKAWQIARAAANPVSVICPQCKAVKSMVPGYSVEMLLGYEIWRDLRDTAPPDTEELVPIKELWDELNKPQTDQEQYQDLLTERT